MPTRWSGVVDSALVSINEVNLRRARLVLGWVTVSGFNSRCAGHLSRYVTSHPGQLSLAIPSWVGAMSTSQRAVMPCGWEVKEGMVRVWMAGKTVVSHCYTRAIPERFRDKGLIKRYVKLLLYLFYFTLPI